MAQHFYPKPIQCPGDLREALQNSGRDMERNAELLGVHVQTLYRWCTGHQKPASWQIISLAIQHMAFIHLDDCPCTSCYTRRHHLAHLKVVENDHD